MPSTPEDKKNSLINAQVSYLSAPYNLEFKTENLDASKLGSQEVLCETIVSAISPGTEIAAYTGMPPLRPGKVYPRLVGYCNVSRVLLCGDDVTDFNTGDRVLTGQCHRSHFITDKDSILTKVPNGLNDEYAACTYLYHLGYDAVIKSNLKYGSPIVIIGLGVLGLAAINVAANAGAIVYGISDQRIPSELAKKSGAIEVFTREQSDKLINTLGPRLADSVISTTNSWDDWELALKVAGKHGNINVLGFPGRSSTSIHKNPLDSQYFYDKQLRIQAVGLSPSEIDSQRFLKFNEKDNINFLINEIAQKRLTPNLLISDIYSWENLSKAYEDLIKRKNSPLTYLLKWKK